MASNARDGRNAYLDGEHHWCDICEEPFDTLVELIRHDCEPSEEGDDAE